MRDTAEVAGTVRMHTVPRRLAGLAALSLVLATGGSAPARDVPGDDTALYAACRAAAQRFADTYRHAEEVSVGFSCERPDGTSADPRLWLPAPPSRPAPVPAVTAGHGGCVTGPGRPVLRTTLTTVRATSPGGELIYEYQRMDGSRAVTAPGSSTLEFAPGELTPGTSYRWRARVDDTAERARDTTLFRDPDDGEMGWSPWCEFAVSPDAADYGRLGDVSLEALQELGLRPDRAYPVSLSGRQQRLLRTGTDIGRTRARMTLTGPRWADLLVQLTESAFIADEVAAETDGGGSPSPDGNAYRALVDAISGKLGGPAHPDLS